MSNDYIDEYDAQKAANEARWTAIVGNPFDGQATRRALDNVAEELQMKLLDAMQLDDDFQELAGKKTKWSEDKKRKISGILNQISTAVTTPYLDSDGKLGVPDSFYDKVSTLTAELSKVVYDEGRTLGAADAAPEMREAVVSTERVLQGMYEDIANELSHDNKQQR